MFRLFGALRQAEVDAKKQEIQEHRQAEQEAKASNSQSVAKLKAWQGLESWETFFETKKETPWSSRVYPPMHINELITFNYYTTKSMMSMFNAERRKPTGFRMCLPAAQALQKQCEVLAEENEEAVGSSACCILKHNEAAS